jgi:hypothetical protein
MFESRKLATPFAAIILAFRAFTMTIHFANICSLHNGSAAANRDRTRSWLGPCGLRQGRAAPRVADEVLYLAGCRGVAYYETTDAKADQACATSIFEGTPDARLIAVDAKTGKPCPAFWWERQRRSDQRAQAKMIRRWAWLA